MDNYFGKLSSYNILNNLIPGSIFCYLLQYINGIDLQSNSVLQDLFIYYFVGMLINRLGSLILEPFAKMVGLVNYVDYTDYLMATKIDGKIDILLETNNLYRTISAGIFLIILVSIYAFAERQISILPYVTPYLVVIVLLLIFLFSYRKQSTYIKKRVEHVVKNKKEGNAE